MNLGPAVRRVKITPQEEPVPGSVPADDEELTALVRSDREHEGAPRRVFGARVRGEVT